MNAKIEDLIHQYADAVITFSNEKDLNSYLGNALFYYHYAEAFDKPEYYKPCITILKKIIESIGEAAYPPSLFNGLAGVLWMINYFKKVEILDIDESELYDLRQIIKDASLQFFENGNYDLFYGGIGCSLSLMSSNTIDSDHFEKIVERLEAILIREDKVGAYCFNRMKTEGCISFDLAHGLPSIMVFLSYLFKLGVQSERCKYLIKSIHCFINRFEKPNELWSFPTELMLVGDQFNPYPNSRLAWCRGDLSIALTFLQSGRMIEDDQLWQQGFDLAMKTLNIQDDKIGRIQDAGLCHGFFGIAYCYKKVFELVGEARFQQAASFWLRKGMKFLNASHSINNYKYWRADLKQWKSSRGMLNGSSGIALVLIHFLKNTNADWDQLFLLSTPTVFN